MGRRQNGTKRGRKRGRHSPGELMISGGCLKYRRHRVCPPNQTYSSPSPRPPHKNLGACQPQAHECTYIARFCIEESPVLKPDLLSVLRAKRGMNERN